jgi:1-aminocyclopropane-1-carboxylate deaminase/D-cysteine desulfhydrase-like pyridoxal-dependent ACC family enzyme
MREETKRMITGITEAELKARLAKLPRIRLAALPTPLQEVPRLTAALGGPRILIKREDLTGVAFGGNKIREFEYSVAVAVELGCDVLLNSAAAQSNQSRQTAAVAAKLGLRSVIVARRDAHAHPVQGNLLLCYLLGAEVHLTSADQQGREKEAVIERLQAQGHKVFDTGYDGAVYRSVAYVDGFMELWEQLGKQSVRPDAIYLCSASHTHAGLVVAAKALGVDVRIVGIPYSPRYDSVAVASRMAAEANRTAAVLELDLGFTPDEIEAYVEFAGPAHGVVTEPAKEAIHLAAQAEGLILDPVYTGKAMAALVQHIREGQFRQDQTVVFMHTGGTPAIFAYNTELGLDV